MSFLTWDVNLGYRNWVKFHEVNGLEEAALGRRWCMRLGDSIDIA